MLNCRLYDESLAILWKIFSVASDYTNNNISDNFSNAWF